MTSRTTLTACLVVAFVAAAQWSAAQAPDAAPTVEPAVPFRAEAPLRSYVAVRRMESRNDRHEKQGWLVARTELRPDGSFVYDVIDEGGSEMIRNRVLRAALEKEVEVHRDGRARRSGLTADNYTFLPATRDGDVVRVGLVPRRREDMLVKGSLVTSPDGEVLRVEGELVKKPSFWTRSVQVVRCYERIAGERVPVRFESVAQVRMVGRSTLTITYEYLEINGEPVATSEPPPTAARAAMRRAAVRVQGIQR